MSEADFAHYLEILEWHQALDRAFWLAIVGVVLLAPGNLLRGLAAFGVLTLVHAADEILHCYRRAFVKRVVKDV